MSKSNEEFMEKVIEEGIKDLIVNKSFTRAERMDSISSSLLGTVGVILSILAGVFSIAIERDVMMTVRMPLLGGCLAFVASMVFLVASLRLRDVKMPTKLNREEYIHLLEKMKKADDRKKFLQNVGLLFLLIGATLTSVVLIALTF